MPTSYISYVSYLEEGVLGGKFGVQGNLAEGWEGTLAGGAPSAHAQIKGGRR